MKHTQPFVRPSLKLVVNKHAVQSIGQAVTASSRVVMSHDDIYIDYLLYGTGMNVFNPDLLYFLIAVLSQCEIRQILTRPIAENDANTGPRIVQLLPIANRFKQMTFFTAFEREVIYVATILHGIQYWLESCEQGKTAARDVTVSIVQDALRRLDREDTKASQSLRMCMGWVNVDEESVLTQWLKKRVHSEISALDQSQTREHATWL